MMPQENITYHVRVPFVSGRVHADLIGWRTSLYISDKSLIELIHGLKWRTRPGFDANARESLCIKWQERGISTMKKNVAAGVTGPSFTRDTQGCICPSREIWVRDEV